MIDVGWWWTLYPSVCAAGSWAKSHQYYHEQVYSDIKNSKNIVEGHIQYVKYSTQIKTVY